MKYVKHTLKLPKPYCAVAAALAFGLGPVTAYAADTVDGSGKTGYAVSRDGQVVQTGAGECVHTSSWEPALSIPGCDGTQESAPEPVAKVTVVETEVAAVETRPTRWSLDAATYFDFDKAQLRQDGEDKLKTIAERLGSEDTVTRVEVTGHTDRIGSESYNQELSRARAEAVSRYLSQQAGIDMGKFVVRGVGESQADASCANTGSDSQLIDCLQPDRRVEIAIDVEKDGNAAGAANVR